MLKTFEGGVHPPDYKELAKDKQLTRAPLPEKIYVVVSQHIGAPARPMVKRRDVVKRGQKIAEAQGFVSANIHSPVNGKVRTVDMHDTCTGARALSILIKVEDDEEEIQRFEIKENPSAGDIKEAVREAGIVGLGGAQFPTHVKLSPPEEFPIDTVILNGCECEPFLNVDFRLMVEEPESLIEGLQLLVEAVGADRAFVGIEDNKPEAIKAMNDAASIGENIQVVPLPTKYPQGSEKHLIKAITGKEVPSGGLPFQVGVLVQNVQTTFAVRRAVKEGIPLVERAITVTGQAVNEPKNMVVPLGMKAEDAINFAGGLKENARKIIFGGPMTGFSIAKLDIPVVKGTSGIVALPEELVEPYPEKDVCIRCGRCVEACPVGIMPNLLGTLGREEMFEEALENNLMDCIECGSCSYICPSRRNLLQFIRFAKAKAKELQSGDSE